jgi:hypothetical protein
MRIFAEFASLLKSYDILCTGAFLCVRFSILLINLGHKTSLRYLLPIMLYTGGGWALEISPFLGPNGTSFTRRHFRATKVSNSGAQPSPSCPRGVARIKSITYGNV